MTTFAVIPARYGSTRFPGKPLAKDTGKYLIQHVYEAVSQAAGIDRVVVATDDDRVVSAVTSFGGEAVLTSAAHATGTERVIEACKRLGIGDEDLVLNVQGDEPEIPPRALDRLIQGMHDDGPDCPIATLAAPFRDDGPRNGPGSPKDPNCVKVVVNEAGRAMYFSRSLVPYPRSTGGQVDRPSRWLLHLGVYAFRAGALAELATAAGAGGSPAISRSADAVGDGSLEALESLEQLRWLAGGWPIAVTIVEDSFVGVDTPEDYAEFVKRTLAGCVGPAG